MSSASRVSLSQRLEVWAKPGPDHLPNRRVVLYPLAFLFAVLVVLVACGITGSSTGFLNQYVNTKTDPNLIAGEPQSIRSDEWLVQSSWTVSQYEQGLPVRNEAFPGGMDATVQHDLPSLDWSMAFRPHLLGFLFLPIDNAMALKWWLPGFAMIAALYLLVVSMLPRRPLTAALISVGFFFAPFFQWWYLSITFWPSAWAFLLMAGIVWLLKTTRRGPRIAFPVAIGYLAVTVGTGIYVPFIIAATLVAIAFAVGYLATKESVALRGFGPRLRRLWPVYVAGLAAAAVLGVWVLTRWETIKGFASTVYPGERLQPVGVSSIKDMLSFFAGTYSAGLGDAQGVPLGANASEASTFLLPGLFLAIPMIWLVLHQARRRVPIDWLVVSLLACGLLIFAFLLVPGWDGLAHLLLLDRTTNGRIRLGAGMLSVVMMIVVLARHDERRRSGRLAEEAPLFPKWAIISASILASAVFAAVGAYLFRAQSSLVLDTYWWILVSVATVVTVWATASGRAFLAAGSFLLASLIIGVGINPVYAGVYDLNGTHLVKTMKQIEAAEPGRWVGVGPSVLPTVSLVQSGLPSFNGFQSTPSPKMWNQIDPTHSDEIVWNRLANVSWLPGSGDPAPMNPAPDQIRMTFDSCADFAQRNVKHVLSDSIIDQSCLVGPQRVRQGPGTYFIYEVVSPRE